MPKTRTRKSQVRDAGPRGDRALSRLAYERVRDAIRSGEFPPGSPVSEMILSQALGISRTPVREALRQLVHEGLVQVTPHRGTVVAVPSLEEGGNLLRLRALVEPEIARLVAENASDRLVARLSRCIETMTSAAHTGDRALWTEADDELHEAITESCPNVLLAQVGMQIRNRMQLVIARAPTSAARLLACTDEHRRVVEAIASRDGAAAQGAVCEHIGKLSQSLVTSFM